MTSFLKGDETSILDTSSFRGRGGEDGPLRAIITSVKADLVICPGQRKHTLHRANGIPIAQAIAAQGLAGKQGELLEAKMVGQLIHQLLGQCRK